MVEVLPAIRCAACRGPPKRLSDPGPFRLFVGDVHGSSGSIAAMDDDTELKKLEQSLGGPNGAPLLIGCDEPHTEIAEAMECLEPDVEYRISVREFQGADTYIITARTPTDGELANLERLMADAESQDEEAVPDEGDGD